MLIAHLMASPFLGGPEKQVLGLAEHLPAEYRSLMISFAEGGRARPFLKEAERRGFETLELRENWPHYFRSAQEIADCLRSRRIDLLCTSGYKPDVIGLRAARLANVPAVAIAHGWTGATWKVRLNEQLDRWAMRRFDCVASVSQAQAQRVVRAGVKPSRMATIPNAVPIDHLPPRDPARRAAVEALFPSPPRIIVAAAGRLSPEKGFEVFVEAAAQATAKRPEAGFVLFGDGPLREQLTNAVRARGLQDRFILAGFRADLADLLPQVDVQVLSSYAEGLPVILLEAMAAGVPVVATRVGGVPEVVADGVHGLLVDAGDAAGLAKGIEQLLASNELRQRLGLAGRARIIDQFSSSMQGERYRALFDRVVAEYRRQ